MGAGHVFLDGRWEKRIYHYEDTHTVSVLMVDQFIFTANGMHLAWRFENYYIYERKKIIRRKKIK